MKEQKINSRGITLVALVITIIILLILAGVAIATLGGENGLLSKVSQAEKTQIKAEMKEKLTLAISELQIEKTGNATLADITQEWGDNKLKDYEPKITDDISTSGKIVTIKKNRILGKFLIDDKLNITEMDTSGINITYKTLSRDGENVNIAITITEIENGIKEIVRPDGSIYEGNGQKEIEIKCTVAIGQEYTIKAISENGTEKEEKILINDYWYTINKNLGEGISIDNVAVKTAYNKPYQATITIAEGYTVGILKVKMGEKIITEDTSIRTINIEKVTDDIEITVICNPLIISSEKESLTLEVEVKYPEIKDINTRKEYSINGTNYLEYSENVLIKDNCTFYARVINIDTNEVIVSSQKEINNIIYEWEVWSYDESVIYVKKQETQTSHPSANGKIKFYSSYKETETGYSVTGTEYEYYRYDSRNSW